MRQTVRYVLKYYSLNCPETVVKTIKWNTLTPYELAKSSTESTMGRSLGIVMQEMRIAVYRYTKTMQDKYQTAPIVRTELYELLVLFFAYMVTITNLSIRKNNKMKNENKSYN